MGILKIFSTLGEREGRARVARGGWVSDDIKVLPGEPPTLSYTPLLAFSDSLGDALKRPTPKAIS